MSLKLYCEICSHIENGSEIHTIDICDECIEKIHLYGIREREVAVLKEAINKILDTQYFQDYLKGGEIEQILKTALDFCQKKVSEKLRDIKFRGKPLGCNNFVYGDLIKAPTPSGERYFILPEGTFWDHLKTHVPSDFIEVIPETVQMTMDFCEKI